MEDRMNRDVIDITQWAGKKQRLQTAIVDEVLKRTENETIPFKLIMTDEQYQMLKKTPEFGDKGEWHNYKATDRIYYTPYNAMQIEIK
jgi:hypothetical protein